MPLRSLEGRETPAVARPREALAADEGREADADEGRRSRPVLESGGSVLKALLMRCPELLPPHERTDPPGVVEPVPSVVAL